MRSSIFTALALLTGESVAAGPADWRTRSIYQVFTDRFARADGSTTYACDVNSNSYCGGTWKGLENKLDYIKDMGFTAVWISPVTAQVDELGYHGYYQTDLYSVNSHFGSPEDLKSLGSALHAKGMYLMVDVVPNHMGWAGCPETVDYKHFKVLNKAEHYHSYCELKNMANQTEVELCWLGNCNITMPDLNTHNPEVAKEMNSWIKSLVSNYSIDGLRIDSVKNVNPDFFPPWCQSAGVFCMGEVSEGQANYTYPYQKVMDSILDYPLYYSINRVFTQKSPMADLVVNLALCTEEENSGCKDAALLGTFFENHDNPRFAFETKDMSLVKNALAYTIMGDGIPIIYQGQEQHFEGGDDPGCREAIWSSGYKTDSPLYKHIAYLNQIRNHISSTSPTYASYWTRILNFTTDTIQMRKDVIRTILTNQGEAGKSSTLTTTGMQFTKGETVVDILTCSKYTSSEKGEVDVKMDKGYPVVLVPESAIKGSSMCG